jgi:DNA-binding CsgD family transcriptional regulator/tetratricopeptide (TPR) repeat protein
MDRSQFLRKVRQLRDEGKSIRAIAFELGVHRNRVHRAITQWEARAPKLPSDDGIFVGRQREMGQLTAALDDAISGQGRLVMLVGEPGIGKTRSAEELASIASQKGALALWGRCPEERGAPPFWPWVQIIRTYTQQTDTDTLLSQMGSGAAIIAEVVPEVQDRLLDPSPGSGQTLKPPPSLEPEQARFRLFDSITTFLKKASAVQPVLLMLDNLHWADASSLRLLEFLAQELAGASILIVGTYRDVDVSRGHPLFHTLGELARQRPFQRVLLRGLGQREVGQVIEVVGGVRPSGELVKLVYRDTEGNPLFVGEVVRYLVQEGMLSAGDVGVVQQWKMRLPEGVREVIGRRLDRLSQECNDVLRGASVIGREFSIQQLERLLNVPQERLLEVLEEALKAHVIEEQPREPGHCQFSHALVQRTLREELSTTRRVRSHARIVEVLEELYEDNLEAHAVELAHHASEAEAVLGAERMIRYSILAGDQALARYGYEEALSHFQRALDAKEGQPVDAEMAHLLFGLGRAQAATFRLTQAQEAVNTLKRAFDTYAQIGEMDKAVLVATYPHAFLRLTTGTAHMTSRALEMVPPDSVEAVHLLCRYGFAYYSERRDYEGAYEALRKAFDIAQRRGDAALSARTLTYSAMVEGAHNGYQEVIEKASEAIELCSLVEDLHSLLRASYVCAIGHSALGHVSDAKTHAEAMLEAAERLRDRHWLGDAIFLNCELAINTGDWQAAQMYNERSLSLSPDHPAGRTGRALLRYHLGESEDTIEHVEEDIQEILDVAQIGLGGRASPYAYAAALASMLARITGASKWIEIAEGAVQAALSSPRYRIRHSTLVLAGIGLALNAAQRGNSLAASEQYAFLRTQKVRLSDGGISVDRILGFLSQTIGNLDDAQTHFEEALVFCRKAGYRPELAWSLYDYACMLLERNASGDRQKATQILSESLAISTELGMKPLMEKVVALKEQMKAQPGRAPQYPDGLTQREVEVLRLVAQAKTNQEIADELFISLRTVTTHVTSILNKINASNRIEAATYATRHGLD